MKLKSYLVITFCLFWSVGLFSQTSIPKEEIIKTADEVLVGAERPTLYLNELKGKNVALVVNPTSEVFNQHLVDFLLTNGINIKIVFAPEHGFRGTADAGERIKDGVDSKTQIPIKSLYGRNKKPSKADLANIDVVVFDIQDVGVRFYTYISTMHYVMQACAENKVQMMVFDRPNPNGFYVDGPVLELSEQSFVGMHQVPIVHGMTIGEYARMINEEGWLGSNLKCNLQVVLLTGWNHKNVYQLPTKPSPNLPNMVSIYLYPTLGLFEGTIISAGRGTDFPFQTFGAPTIEDVNFTFVPQSVEGATYPKFIGQTCYGRDLRNYNVFDFYLDSEIHLELILWAYSHTSNKEDFFLKNHFYGRLAGTSDLQKQIIEGVTVEEIRSSWEPKLSNFKLLRKKYLLYPDF